MVKRGTAITLVGLFAAAGAAAAQDRQAAWPQANGPFGNFNPRRFGHKLVDDLNDAKRLWATEDGDLGFAKGSSSGYANHLAAGRSGRTPALPYPADSKEEPAIKEPWRPPPEHPWRKPFLRRRNKPDISICPK